MICIVQNGMYCPAWYVFSSIVCIFKHGMYCPLYSICYLFIGMTGDNPKEIKKNAKFKVFLMVNNKITGISCEDLVKYPVSRGKWLVIACENLYFH
jgi:hypothetical protein